MTLRRVIRRGVPLPLLFACMITALRAQSADAGLVQRALAAELHNADTSQHPMRYRMHKVSPRLSTTKEILETRDGAVARLVAINDKPLSADDEQKEQDRLNGLLTDPSRQRHRKQAEDADTARVLKVLRVLPDAFLYKYAGTDHTPAGDRERFSFTPNPKFQAPDLETTALASMSGSVWVDASSERVVRLEGHLEQDVDFGWGILGKLYKGGWIIIDQADIGNHQWRITRFQMVMTGRVLFKTKSFDTTEEQSNYTPVPVGLNYTQAIQMLRSQSDVAQHAAR